MSNLRIKNKKLKRELEFFKYQTIIDKKLADNEKEDYDDFYAYLDEQVTNITTALMAIKDVATCTDIPINVQFDSHVITVIVNFGKWNVKMEHFYLQDTYRYHQSKDMVYKWIKEAVEEIVKFREV